MNAPFQFAPAVRAQVSLLIALAGASGSGKTFSALRLAKGMAPSGKIAFIDTEARRGLHYAGQFDFLHTDMRPPFRPGRFIDAIHAAEKVGAEVVIIDSFSHEYDGIGGILEWADELAEKGVKSPGNFKEPKLAHRKLMNELLQVRASLIFCLRADEKIEIVREDGKTKVRPLGWMPICEKRFMYEMTASFTLTPDRPGVPHFDLPHKLQSQHRGMFTDQEPISETAGVALAEWARGGSSTPAPRTILPASSAPAPSALPPSPSEQSGAGNVPVWDEYVERWDAIIADATDAQQLHELWSSKAHKGLRNKITWPDDDTFDKLKARVEAKIKALKG